MPKSVTRQPARRRSLRGRRAEPPRRAAAAAHTPRTRRAARRARALGLLQPDRSRGAREPARLAQPAHVRLCGARFGCCATAPAALSPHGASLRKRRSLPRGGRRPPPRRFRAGRPGFCGAGGGVPRYFVARPGVNGYENLHILPYLFQYGRISTLGYGRHGNTKFIN